MSSPTNQLFQFSTVSALMDGVAEKGLPLSDLASHGDFGLGTFRHIVGEMIVVDGTIYQMKSDGSVHVIDSSTWNETVTPFAMVTRFQASISTKVPAQSKEDLARILSKLLPGTKNHYLAFRIDGAFKELVVRTVGGQQVPHESLSELGKRQASHSFKNIQGTIIGFRSPSFMQGISVAGDHLHFISADRSHGGHLLALETEGYVELTAAPIWTVHMEFPRDDEDFNEANLRVDSEGIATVEG